MNRAPPSTAQEGRQSQAVDADPDPELEPAAGSEGADSIPGRFEAARQRWRETIGERETRACPHCGQDFARSGYLALHLGRRHPDRLSPRQEEQYRAVEEAEGGVMHELALHTKSGLFALPLFIVWAATLVLLIEMDANVAWIVLSTPGYVLFGGLIYVMAYGYQTGGREDYYGRG